MCDLIDRQAILKHIEKIRYGVIIDDTRMASIIMNGMDLCEKAVMNQPSAQPEIIFCKNCKWSDWYDAADGHRCCFCMTTGASGRTADDFCSYAERLEA